MRPAGRALRPRCAACIVAAVCIGVAGASSAARLPRPGTVDPRVRTAQYQPGQVYRLQARVGYQIELVLETGETLVGQGAGDLEGIALAAFGNHVFIKPRARDVATNLTLLTNRRRYRFDYVVTAGPAEASGEGVMYVVRFTYPPRAGQDGPSQARRIEAALAAAGGRAHNLDYWYCGDRSIRPTAASDDGVHTRLRFDARGELPALFVRNEDGSESLLNYSMDGGDVIVHRVARRFIVRRGRLTGCIVNRGFAGGGERLDSGTIAPQVQRALKEPAR